MSTMSSTPIAPTSFNQFVGQDKTKRILEILVKSAKKRSGCVPHILLCGQPGLGKTTLARIICSEMNSNLHEIVASSIQNTEQLVSHLKSIRENDVVFIDEIHALGKSTEETIYSALEQNPRITIPQQGIDDFFKNLGMTMEQSAMETIELPPFTMIGATTETGSLSSPLRSRFSQTLQLEPYSITELAEIIINASIKISFPVSDDVAFEIAKRSRFTARTAIGFVRWYYEFITATEKAITTDSVFEAFELKDVDKDGLNKLDRSYLSILIDNHGTVGLGTLAIALGESEKTLEQTVEPYLLQAGFIRRTTRGRIAQDKAHKIIQCVEMGVA